MSLTRQKMQSGDSMSETLKLTPEELRELQMIEVEMLVEIDRICKKCGISYCISAGTQLGAIRHKGYIPWDDDADIAMLREEYEKFVYNRWNNGSWKDCCQPAIKVRFTQ